LLSGLFIKKYYLVSREEKCQYIEGNVNRDSDNPEFSFKF